MRVGIIHPELLNRGGAESFTWWLASGLRDRGHEVEIFSAGIDPDQWSELDLTNLRLVDLPDHDYGFWHQPLRSRRHGAIIGAEAGPLDLLIAGNYPSYLWLADALPRMAQRPATLLFCQEPLRNHYFVHTDWPVIDYVESGKATLPFHDELVHHTRHRIHKFHYGKRPLARWYDHWRLKHIDHILANSEFSRRNAEAAFGRPVEPFLLGAPDPRHGQPLTDWGDREGVAVLTGWNRAKNPVGVLGTVAHLANVLGRRDIRFTVSGRTFPSEFREYVHDEDLKDVIHHAGFISEEEKHRLLGKARLCLFIPWAEPFGLVPVEAMFNGTPVVAAELGGPAEIVVDGVTGALVDGSDPAAIATAIDRLYDDQVTLAAMGRAGRARALERFSVDDMVDRFEARATVLVDQYGPGRR